MPRHLSLRPVAISAAVAAMILGAAPASFAADDNSAIVAQSCYGSATSFTKSAGQGTYPYGFDLTTTANCGDINVKMPFATGVKVCFAASGCQNAYKYTRVNEWIVVASNVRDGSRFNLKFQSFHLYLSGQYAA